MKKPRSRSSSSSSSSSSCRAHEIFKEEMEIGEDGRPDFAARKSCNYMESAIQVYDKIGAIYKMKLWYGDYGHRGNMGFNKCEFPAMWELPWRRMFHTQWGYFLYIFRYIFVHLCTLLYICVHLSRLRGWRMTRPTAYSSRCSSNEWWIIKTLHCLYLWLK